MTRILIIVASFFLILPVSGLADDKGTDNDAVVEKSEEQKQSGKDKLGHDKLALSYTLPCSRL